MEITKKYTEGIAPVTILDRDGEKTEPVKPDPGQKVCMHVTNTVWCGVEGGDNTRLFFYQDHT